MEDERKFSQEELDALANQELRRLATDFRRMLQDREACKKQTLVILTNQKKYMKILENEKEELMKEVSFKESKSSKKNQAMLIKDINKLLESYNKCVKDGKEKKGQIAELKTRIKDVSKDIHEYSQNHQIKFINLEKERLENTQLESLLANETTHLKQILTENKQLQTEVNFLLIERQQFNGTYNKTLQNLTKGKKFLFDLIDRCNDAYDSRHKVNFQIETLKTESEKFLKQNCYEFHDLDQELQYHEHENYFLCVKSNRRSNEEIEKEKDIHEMTMRVALENKLTFYNNIISDITGEFGPDDLERVINTFIKIDDDNFQLYSFLSYHNTKINAIVKEVEAMEKEIIDLQEANEKKKFETVCHNKMMEAQSTGLKMQTEQKKQSLKEFEKDLHKILEGATILFNNLACDWTPMSRNLGMKDNITPYNVNLFLKAMEHRLRVLSTTMRFKTEKSRRLTRTGHMHSSEITLTSGDKRWQRGDQKVLVTPCPYCIDLLDSSDSSEIVKPLEKEEIYESARKEMKRLRWRQAMHNVAECPLHQGQRAAQMLMAQA